MCACHGDVGGSGAYGQMNEPPGARARVALTGLTVAEYFRDQEGKDVLLFIDNIFRFTQAGSEVSEGREGKEASGGTVILCSKLCTIWSYSAVLGVHQLE